jgi:hypothetical protein
MQKFSEWLEARMGLDGASLQPTSAKFPNPQQIKYMNIVNKDDQIVSMSNAEDHIRLGGYEDSRHEANKMFEKWYGDVSQIYKSRFPDTTDTMYKFWNLHHLGMIPSNFFWDEFSKGTNPHKVAASLPPPQEIE